MYLSNDVKLILLILTTKEPELSVYEIAIEVFSNVMSGGVCKAEVKLIL